MPVIVKTPLRISLFGGGTDYREYFERSGGAVLGGTIDKYIYIVCLPMSPVADTRYRLTYSKVETIDHVADIQHPVIREVLKDEGYDVPFNLAVISDIPGGSGLGSSSAFTVGFLNLVRHLKGQSPTKSDLARAAVRVESELLQERVGVQDQYHGAFGGFSLYEFHKDNTSISPIQMSTEFRARLNDSIVLVHTKRYRSASAVLEEQVQKTRDGKVDNDLETIKALCYEARTLFQGKNPDTDLIELGRMLSETWRIKRSLSSLMSNADLDEIYDRSMALGAYGGKLAGAGGGGFFMFLAPPETIRGMREVFGNDRVVKIEFQDEGSRLMKAF
jgi:D-glycero-alpha-D-manno-heptose-7-phosphate kinase